MIRKRARSEPPGKEAQCSTSKHIKTWVMGIEVKEKL